MRDLYRGAWVNSFRLLTAALPLLLAACSTFLQTPPAPELSKLNQDDRITAEKRIAAWEMLIQVGQNVPDARKLALANDFINSLAFMNDLEHWHQADYWATPLETVSSGGGDCEDLAIAKYFTLKYMHVPEERLRIVYVKSRPLHKSHMVLAYYPAPGADPLLLDNLDPEIQSASHRSDLLLIYSFNDKGLWLARKPDVKGYMGSANRIAPWRNLLGKIRMESYNLAQQTPYVN